MRKTVAALVAAATIAVATVAVPSAADAQWHRGWGWHGGFRGPGPFFGGLFAGALIAGALAPRPYYYGYYGYPYGPYYAGYPYAYCVRTHWNGFTYVRYRVC